MSEIEIPDIDRTAFAAAYGPWAVIAGASDGTGAEFAEQLAAMGINVVLAARRGELLEELGSRLARQHGIEYRALVVDLTAPDAAQRLLDGSADLDVGLYVSNAGVLYPHSTFLGAEPDHLRRFIAMNVLTLTDVLYGFAGRFRERGRGGILFVGSGAALGGSSHLAMYGATKAFGQVLAEALAAELEPEGVDVLAVLAPAMTTPSMVRARNGVVPEGYGYTPHDSAAVMLAALGRQTVLGFGEAQEQIAAQRAAHLVQSREWGKALVAAGVAS